MVTRRVLVSVVDLERAVYGLVGTTDEGAELVRQLELCLLPERVQKPVLTAAEAQAALEECGSVKAAARRLGRARSTVREAAKRGRPVCQGAM